MNRVSRFIRRELFRDSFLLEVKRWFKDRGDDTLRLDYPLDENSIVVDLGGYLGDFSAAIHSRYGCFVHLFEPVPRFYTKCVERFEGNEKIQCHPYALSSQNGTLEISDDDDASSLIIASDKKEKTFVDVRSVAEEFRKLKIKKINLVKINIEGGEYDIMPALIESGIIGQIDAVQVQFHNFIDGAIENRSRIQRELTKTHKMTWNYEFVWENWEIRN